MRSYSAFQDLLPVHCFSPSLYSNMGMPSRTSDSAPVKPSNLELMQLTIARLTNLCFSPQNYWKKAFFERFCEGLCPCRLSGQYIYTNDMTLSAKDIARNFLLFVSEIPLEQLSGDSVTNASSLYLNPSPKKNNTVCLAVHPAIVLFKYANFYVERHYSHESIGIFSFLRKKRTKQQPKSTCTSTRIK